MLRTYIAICGLLLPMLGLAEGNTVTACQSHQCMAVVDVGSSGSRLHIFAYDLETAGPVNIQEITAQKITPGLASLPADETVIDQYLDTLFKHIQTPPLPVYFYATAGMRLLSPAEQMARYHHVTKWFADHTQWRLQAAKTISGRDEGLYGWVAVNYQLHAFQSGHYVGVMDMGGASVQIAFPLQNTQQVAQGDITTVNLYGHSINLFVKSFLGLGQNEMINRLQDEPVCFAQDYPLKNGASGAGDALGCAGAASKIINNQQGVRDTVIPVLAAHPVAQWYTIGGLSMFAQSTWIDLHNIEFTSELMLDRANTNFCHQSWAQVQKIEPITDKNYAYCLISSYYYALLTEDYGLKPTEVVGLTTPEEQMDWALGVLLTQLSHPAKNT